MKKVVFLTILSLSLCFAASASATIIDFSDYTDTAYKGQPQYPSQGVTGDFQIHDSTDGNSGARLKLVDGDIWMNFEIPVTVTENTFMHIEVRDRLLGTTELTGVQFLGNFANPSLEPSRAFTFSGSQNWGIMDYRTTSEGWESFDIHVGNYFTGVFEGLSFYADNDVYLDDPEGRFQNVEFTSAPVPEPSTFLLLGSGILGLGWYRLKRKKA